jgi:hypothetical protein
MKIVCAWCAKEGKPSVIGEKEPLDVATTPRSEEDARLGEPEPPTG